MWVSDLYTCKYCSKFQCDTVSTDSKERVTFPTSVNWINYTKSFWWSLNSKCDISKWILYVRLVLITTIITSKFLKRHDFPNGSLVDTFHLAIWKTINAVYYAKFQTLTFPNKVLESWTRVFDKVFTAFATFGSRSSLSSLPFHSIKNPVSQIVDKKTKSVLESSVLQTSSSKQPKITTMKVVGIIAILLVILCSIAMAHIDQVSACVQ